MNFETIVKKTTMANAPSPKVILQTSEQCSLHHVDINPINSMHILHHHVYGPTSKRSREATLLIHPNALSCERIVQGMQSLHGIFVMHYSHEIMREALGSVPMCSI